MKQTKFSVETDNLDELLKGSLRTDSQPDEALLCRVKYRMHSAAHAPKASVLPWLPALCGSAMTGACVFVLTLLIPNPPWKQLIMALGCLSILSAWALTICLTKYKLFNEERNLLWQL